MPKFEIDVTLFIAYNKYLFFIYKTNGIFLYVMSLTFMMARRKSHDLVPFLTLNPREPDAGLEDGDLPLS